MSKNITQRLSGAVAVLASIAMLFCVLPLPSAHAADASGTVGADAAADANVYQALKYMQELNALRARTDRRALTNAQIAAAKNADHNTNVYNTSNVASYTADGSAVGALAVNWDLMKWAQTRANELVQKGNLDGHANMLNGKPSWYVYVPGRDFNLAHSPKYQSGTYFDGPEALALSWTSVGGLSGDAVDSWYSELNYEIEHPNASASDLQNNRQGYGHYLTEVSPLADIAGVGVAVKDGYTITVLEIGNNYSKQGKTQSVEDAMKQYEPKATYTVKFDSKGGSAVDSQTVESGETATAPAAPTKSGSTFGGWYSDANLTTKYDFSSAVTGNITLYARWDAITITSLDDATAVSTSAGVDPTDQLPEQVTAHYSDGSSKPVDVKWDSINKSDYATANTSFTVNGTVDGTSKKAKVTVNVTAAVPTGAVAAQASVSTIATHAPDLSKVKATVTYSDGTTQQADVTWNTPTPDQYATENANGFDVNGTVTVGDKTFTVTVKVIVTARTIKSVTAPDDQTVESGTEPTYPDTVAVTYNDGEAGTANVTWTKLTKDQYGKHAGGEFTVKGTVDGYADGVSFKVTVNPATVKSVEPSATTAQTVVNQTPDLSGITATVTYTNGDTETKDITWEETTADQFKTADDTVPVKGSVTVDGKAYEFTVNVTVVAATVDSVTGPSADTPAVTVESGDKPDFSNVKATVTWSNGTTTQESVTWNEPNKADYTNRKGGTFAVNGKVSIAGRDYKVTATYKVNPATAQQATPTDGTTTITVDSGTDPTAKLPKSATVTWSNGDTTTSPITWITSYNEADWKARAGKTFTVNGTVDPDVETTAKAKTAKVKAAAAVALAADATTTLSVTVKVKVNPATITKVADIPTVPTEAKVDPTPNLPKTVKTDWSNGETGVDTPITWDKIKKDDYAKRGEFTVKGKATDATTGETADVKVTVKVTAKAESAAKLGDVTVDSGTDPFENLPTSVKVTYSDDATENADITWDTKSYTKDDYSKRKGGSFEVKGKAAGLDVTVKVNVNPATVKSVDTTPVTVGATVGVQPTLPDHTTAEWSNGETETIAVTWPAIAADKLDKAGSFEIESNPFTVDGKNYTIKATVTVTAATVKSVDRDVKVTTTAGKAPALPKTVKAHWSDGSTTDAAVKWDDVPAAKYAKAGTFSVKGIATVNGTDYEVTATVTVTSGDKLVQTPSQKTNNTLTTTGSSVAIIAVVVVLLVVAAVALFVLTKRKKQ
ncbi:Ig-like domain-containing protein [Bifidobacterium stellenboschense]|uniref:Glycoside hydrolase family protein n=1 Tax=Bifidobacterium stellenboschense TaxID=762211 RepID=A0A087DRB6_9BIFI|nr:Ig-like domain-containing protein [Bifidobacterium stellenboschense]KFI98066.1 glycoside hydrolase family protein [Bifidobacterium stellenboschense]